MDVGMVRAGARETARPRQKSIWPAHQAVAEALRLHLAHVAAPLAFGHLLADHLAALLFKRRAVVPWVGLLRGLSRSRQRDQRKQQYDHPHLSLRVVSPSREVNTHAHALVLRNFRDARANAVSHLLRLAVHRSGAWRTRRESRERRARNANRWTAQIWREGRAARAHDMRARMAGVRRRRRF